MLLRASFLRLGTGQLGDMAHRESSQQTHVVFLWESLSSVLILDELRRRPGQVGVPRICQRRRAHLRGPMQLLRCQLHRHLPLRLLELQRSIEGLDQIVG